MSYRLAIDGDLHERRAWSAFVQTQFPSYEHFWQKYVVPLTARPYGLHFKSDPELAAQGLGPEAICMAQLHYTVLANLLKVHDAQHSQQADDLALFVGLSALTAAQDVAFELLQRFTNQGKYDPWTETRPRGQAASKKLSGQEAQEQWKRDHAFPLQHIRDYRNKLIHGRTPPALLGAAGIMLPSVGSVDKYCDWRMVTDPQKVRAIPAEDFQYARVLLAQAWDETLQYLEENWRQHLVP